MEPLLQPPPPDGSQFLSGSSHLDSLTDVAPQNAGKLVGSSAHPPIAAREVFQLMPDLKVVREGRKAVLQVIRSLGGTAKVVESFRGKLNAYEGQMAGIKVPDNKIAAVIEKEQISALLVRAQLLRIELIEEGKWLTRLTDQSKNETFLHLIDAFQRVMNDLIDPKNQKADYFSACLEQFRKEYKAAPKPQQNRYVHRAIARLYKHAMHFFAFTAKKLGFAYVEEQLAEVPSKEPPRMNRKVHPPIVDREDFAYPDTGKEVAATAGRQLQKEVGVGLGWLLEQLDLKRKAICQGVAPDDSARNIVEIEEYTCYYYQLKEVFEKWRKDIDQEPLIKLFLVDKLSKNLFIYIYGLEGALDEARSKLNLLHKAIQEPALKVLHRLHGQTTFYSSDLRSLETVLKLGSSVKEAREAHREATEPKTKFEAFLHASEKLMYEIHYRQDEAILTPTEDEAGLLDRIVKEKSLEPLYQQGEIRLNLPKIVVSFMAKRMMAYLHLSEDAKHMEMEVELLLAWLRLHNRKAFEVSRVDQPRFFEILDQYETKIAAVRKDYSKPLQLLPLLQSDDILDYAKAWQLFWEYNDLQSRELFEKRFSLKGQFPKIYPFMYSDVEVWDIKDEPGFLTKFQATVDATFRDAPQEGLEARVFDSLLFRIGAGACLAENNDEMEKCKRVLTQILNFAAPEDSDLQKYLDQLSDSTKELLSHNALHLIGNCNFSEGIPLTDYEQHLLLDGPLTRRYTGEAESLDVFDLPFSIIVEHENDPNGKFTQALKAKRGFDDSKLASWRVQCKAIANISL